MPLQTEVSKYTPGHAREMSRQAGHVGDAGVGDDQPDALVALDEGGEMVGDRRQPAAAVDQDRHVALDGDREDRLQAGVADRELLRARMELDPARAEVEATGRLLRRAAVEIEPDERDEQALRALGSRERPLVRRPEGRLAVGLVQAERERAREAVVAEHGRQLVVVADHAVDVVAEMRVRVEEDGAGRQLRPGERRVRGDQPLRTNERVHRSIVGRGPESPLAGDRCHLRAQVGEVGLRIEIARAGETLERLPGCELAAQ